MDKAMINEKQREVLEAMIKELERWMDSEEFLEEELRYGMNHVFMKEISSGLSLYLQECINYGMSELLRALCNIKHRI